MATRKPRPPSVRRDDGPPAPLPVPIQKAGNGTYVQCTACGGLRMPGGPHAATHLTTPPLPWPQCEHGAAYMADCRSNAVPPPCCRGES